MKLKKIFNRRVMKRVGLYGTLLTAAMLYNNQTNEMQWGADTSFLGDFNRQIEFQINKRDCTALDRLTQLPENTRRHKIGDYLASIEKYSPTGKMLVDYARETDVRFCERPLTDHGGVFIPKYGVIGMNVSLDDPARGAVYVLAHELFHPGQHYDVDFKYLSAKDMVLDRLAREGAAEIAAIRVAHEMKENGYKDAWDWQNERLPSDYKVMQEFYDVMYQLMRNSGKTAEEAEDISSRSTYRMYFSQPILNGRLLRIQGVLGDIANYNFKGDLDRAGDFTLEDMRKVATLPNGFDFVGDMKVLPDQCDIDGGIVLFRQAINAMHAHYHGIDPEDDPAPDQTYGIFRDLDMDEAVRRFQSSETKGDIIASMIVAQGRALNEVPELIKAANKNAPPQCDREEHFGLPRAKPQKKQPGTTFKFNIGV